MRAVLFFSDILSETYILHKTRISLNRMREFLSARNYHSFLIVVHT